MRVFVLGFVAGAILLQHEAELPSLALGLTAPALLLGAFLVPADHPLLRLCIVGAAALIGGYGYAAWRAELRLADALPHALEGRDVVVTGIVAGLPRVTERGTRFVFHRETGDAVPRTMSLTWYAERDAGAPALFPGQRWQMTLRLKRPRGLANPHGFDFEGWALQRGVRATGYVRNAPAPRLLAQQVDGWPQTLHRWRAAIRDDMRMRLGDAPYAGVLVALAIGDQDAIAARDWDVFWRTGVGHLMSISGLHITMLAALAYAVAVFAWVRIGALALHWPARKAGIVAGVMAAFAYTLLTGYQVPAQRTFCMLAAIALCILVDRHGSPSRVLALAALAVVAFDPWAVTSSGFWLSFGAVAAIFLAMSLRPGLHGRIHVVLREQLAVTVAMVPMLVALFGEVSLVSPLANAIAIPLVSLLVVPLALAGAFLPLTALLEASHALIAASMQLLEWLARLPAAMLESHAPQPWTVALALVGCAWLLAPRGLPMRACGALWMAPMFLIAPSGPAQGEAWIDVLDVGNGLAVVVRTNAAALGYDTGPAWSEESDSGSRIVVPFLRGEGVRRLEGLVVSHADDDHAGGAFSVAGSREPAWLLSPLAGSHALHRAVARSIPCETGLRWHWHGVEFQVLHPSASGSADKPRKENDRSCVLRVATRGAAALLTGDIEARSERELLERNAAALKADVLLVPHHGSRTSSTPGFIDAVAPRVAIVSTGYRNRFRHPNEAVVARYAARGSRVFRTDLDGALRIVLPAAASQSVAVRGLAPPVRYWSERRRSP